MQKLHTFFSKNISIYAIFNDQSFIDPLTDNIVSVEQLGPGLQMPKGKLCHDTGSVQVTEWLALPASDMRFRVRIPLEAEFNSWLYGASLHRTFYYQPSSVSIWLK